MYDLLIRGGTVIDGTGTKARRADVAIMGERIAGIGEDLGRAHRTINATDQLVLPGWVDVHTHYDGQATWDPYLTPSSWHGVTSTVFGNCGVGFAPIRPGSEDYLINLMQGVEDIPGTVLAEGIDFGWESFPEYLDVLESMPRASSPTFLLTHWGRDRKRGAGLPIEHLVEKQTRKTAQAYGLNDRGVLAAGYRADVNVVDFAALNVTRPGLVYDLPAGGRRFVQRAIGYRHTFVGGIEIACDGDHTGEFPGRLIRGPQPLPMPR